VQLLLLPTQMIVGDARYSIIHETTVSGRIEFAFGLMKYR